MADVPVVDEVLRREVTTTPLILACGVLVAICIGVWIGVALSGGPALPLHDHECDGCRERRDAERAILDADEPLS
jgi:hypothetical protein